MPDSKKGVILKMMLLYFFCPVACSENRTGCPHCSTEGKGQKRGFWRSTRHWYLSAHPSFSAHLTDLSTLNSHITSQIPQTSLCFPSPKKRNSKEKISSRISCILQEKYCQHSWFKNKINKKDTAFLFFVTLTVASFLAIGGQYFQTQLTLQALQRAFLQLTHDAQHSHASVCGACRFWIHSSSFPVAKYLTYIISKAICHLPVLETQFRKFSFVFWRLAWTQLKWRGRSSKERAPWPHPLSLPPKQMREAKQNNLVFINATWLLTRKSGKSSADSTAPKKPQTKQSISELEKVSSILAEWSVGNSLHSILVVWAVKHRNSCSKTGKCVSVEKKTLQTSVKSTRYVTGYNHWNIFIYLYQKAQRQIIIMHVKDKTAFLSIVYMQVDVTWIDTAKMAL